VKANLKRGLAVDVTAGPQDSRDLLQHAHRPRDMLEDFLKYYHVHASVLEWKLFIGPNDVDARPIMKIEVHRTRQAR
jgi:hypothetical protein